MPARVRPQDWLPIDIDELEPNAWEALTHLGSSLVVAGPGAGKTEFLAQRAAYLLQTGVCPAPYRILAISFKVDAAENLARRVKSRCTDSEARRFVSLTFDSFTKGLVDRFSRALPEPWRLTRPYDVFLPPRGYTQAFLHETLQATPPVWTSEMAGLSDANFESRTIGSQRLPVGPIVPNSGSLFVAQRWWDERLRGARSSPTFTCLNRLAELAIRTNPQLRRALNTTYPYVFVDEFQDTTFAQYDFLDSVFSDSETRITAVGDEKQRIMTWAGARSDVLSQFESDFDALRTPLVWNHRSSPALVRVQQVVARGIDASASEVESRVASEVSDDVARVWRFPTPAHEAGTIADWLENDMAIRGTPPRDYALLVRQRAADLEEQLLPEFDQRGLRLRNESRNLGRTTLQDLLAEESTLVALALLRLGAHARAPEAWDRASHALMRLRAIDPGDEEASQAAQDELATFIRSIRNRLRGAPTSEAVDLITDDAFSFLDPDALRRAYSEYTSGERLEIAMEAFRLHLQNSAAASDNWVECLDLFEGQDSIPLMTVHKSKGLEYDTVVFIGLDDQSWWSHQPGDVEGRSTFFVALSRAKQRAVFTYCEGRGRKQVEDLYQLLADAGVPEVILQ